MQNSEKLINFLEKEFGISMKVFEKFDLIEKDKKVWLCAKNILIPDMNVQTIGINLFKLKDDWHYPSSIGIRALEKHIAKNIIEIDLIQLNELFENKSIECKGNTGYRAIKFRNKVIGLGYCKEGKMHHLIPKHLMNDLKQF